ncbi:hypothetical protein Vretimale_6565, partial [Volvox reticuliferus]
EVHGPSSAAAWLASARSLPYGSGGGGGAARGQQHRPSRLVLTFPQFVEALRLVAEEAGGHPTRTAAAERALLRIVHDIVREGCPRPDPTTATGTAQLRRQQVRRAAGVTASSTTRPQTAPVAEQPPSPSPPVPPTAAAVTELPSGGTSSTTSTKYTYDDFTPPESDLYTSATSSRISSRPGSASGGRNAGKAGGAAAATAVGGSSSSSTSTSAKYTYSDFTAPDSNLYTSGTSSASGSKVGGSRGGFHVHQSLSTQSWRPQPLRAFTNPNVGGSKAEGKPLPTQLQPKKRSGTAVPAAPAATTAPAAAAAPPAGQTPSWIATMPPPPSSRIRTSTTLPVSAHRALSGGGASGGGGAGEGANGSSVSRQRPMSAPRVRQQPPAVGLGERVEYIWYGTGTAAVGVDGSGGDRPTSHLRPASAKQPVGPYSAGAELASPSGLPNSIGGGSATGCAAAAVTPPFTQRARPASASAQRPRPHTASDGNGRPRSPPPQPAFSYQSVAAAAVTSGPTTAAIWDPPGVSGQVRVGSPTKTRPSSANAALGGRRGSPATARQPVSGSRGGGTASGCVGVPSPLSRPSNAAAAATPAAAAVVVGGNRPPTGRPSLQSNLGRTSGNSRTPSGTGFVAPLVPAGGNDGGGGASDRSRSPPPRPPSAAVVAVAAAMKG